MAIISDSSPCCPRNKRYASPLAYKIAAKSGINLIPYIGKGSGPRGRIMSADIANFSSHSSSNTAGTQVTPCLQEEYTGILQDSCIVDPQQLHFLYPQINKQVAHTHGTQFVIRDFVVKALLRSLQCLPELHPPTHNDPITIITIENESSAFVTYTLEDARKKSLLHIVRAILEKITTKDVDTSEINRAPLAFHITETKSSAEILYAKLPYAPAIFVVMSASPDKRINLSFAYNSSRLSPQNFAIFKVELITLLENPTLILL